MTAITPALDRDTRLAVIAALLRNLRDRYVFPDIAEALEGDIRRRLSGGEYDAVADGPALAVVLTVHLQAISHDKHLRVFHEEEAWPVGDDAGREPDPEERERQRQVGQARNFGFQRVERLPGNVGLLELRQFADPAFAGDLAVAAMTLLAHTEALIVDLRQNGGGDPAMVALLTTYLFDGEPVHLNSLYWRAGDRTHQWWTLPYVPGPRFGGAKPVYVLTSGRTFSGAEEFAYNLKTRGRATIVGETTGGGAHPGDRYPLAPHFAAFIPTGRAINPLTGTNWEGTGVAPDIDVPQEEAPRTAHAAALRRVLERLGDPPAGPRKTLREEVVAALAELEAGAEPEGGGR